MTTDVSLYLLREDSVEPPFAKPDEWAEFEPRERKKHDGLRCFIKQSPASPPKWATWLGEVFDFKKARPVTRSAGAIVLLSSANRKFAITFGTGWQGLAKEAIERDFGLRVALNQLKPEKLRHLVTKTVDLRSRQRSTYHHTGAELDNFDLDVDVEWLRSAAGPTERQDCSLVAGADSFKLRSYAGQLEGVEALCGELLSIYAKGIPAAFDFADNLRPIPKTAPEHAKLEAEILNALDTRPLPDFIELLLDSAEGTELSSAYLVCGRTSVLLSDVTRRDLEQAIDQLKSSSPQFDMDTLQIRLTDTDGETMDTIPLGRAIQAEVRLNGYSYIRLEGRWFLVGKNYIKKVNARLRDLVDVTTELKMPDWPSGLSEEEYNKAAASQRDWLCEDQRFLRPGAGAAIESCDLLTKDWSLIHVKMGNRASSLHHQLGQLVGAASLLRRDLDMAAEMDRRYQQKWGVGSPAGAQKRFVMAVGRERHEASVFGKMLLAKISVLDQARRVRALGYGFAIARIEVLSNKSTHRKRSAKKVARSKAKGKPRS